VVNGEWHRSTALRRSFMRSCAPRRAFMLLLIACTAGFLVGCHGRTVPPSGTPSADAAVSTSGPAGLGATALDVYSKLLAAYAHAGLTADAGDPALAEFAVGDALKTLQEGLRAYHAANQIVKGAYASEPHVTSVSAESVSIIDCLDGTHFLVYTTSGRLADTTPGGRHSTTVVVTRSAQGWRVSALAIHEVGSC
jgi:hypothetical protein